MLLTGCDEGEPRATTFTPLPPPFAAAAAALLALLASLVPLPPALLGGDGPDLAVGARGAPAAAPADAKEGGGVRGGPQEVGRGGAGARQDWGSADMQTLRLPKAMARRGGTQLRAQHPLALKWGRTVLPRV